ncbi:MAG: hypothetical protein K9H26_06695 [Prolixibacteraceae bacterium]|nr:hypothetical protein [Prolixibacteraceae bacterium]
MKKAILLILTKTIVFSNLFAQTIENPFSKFGYDKKVMYTSSKGDYEEFHDNKDVVEIGTVYFNTKTKKVVGYVNEEKEKAEVASATSAMSVDPLCEKYYWISPYAYCANNPIKYVDPDGNDLVIFYNNNQDSYRYTGGNVQHSNKYVNNVIKAYNYNISNGGGNALRTAATDHSIKVGVTEAVETQSASPYVYWNSDMGLETKEGDVLSPSTCLEHEVDHVVDAIKNPEGHNDRKEESDANYTNKEERRVITGNESKTAKANGEIGTKNISRSSHGGNKKVIVSGGVTSTTIDQQKTVKFQKELEDDRGKRLISE